MVNLFLNLMTAALQNTEAAFSVLFILLLSFYLWASWHREKRIVEALSAQDRTEKEDGERKWEILMDRIESSRRELHEDIINSHRELHRELETWRHELKDELKEELKECLRHWQWGDRPPS